MHILSIHTKHDANFCISNGRDILLFIEIEKVSKVRYFNFSQDKEIFKDQINQYVIPYITSFNISEVILNWVSDVQFRVLKEIFPNVVKWKTASHHLSHAWSNYLFTNPKNNDLIISFDGGGDLNDTFKIFRYQDEDIHLLENIKLNIGATYRIIGLYSPEIEGDVKYTFGTRLDITGKAMALAAYGRLHENYISQVENFYKKFSYESIEMDIKVLFDDIGKNHQKKLSLKEARDLICVSQYTFEKFFHETIRKYLPNYNRIILTGGCALNVVSNTKLYKTYKGELFISPGPNDCTISLGGMKFFYRRIAPLKSPNWEIPLKKTISTSKYDDSLSRKETTIEELAYDLFDNKIIGIIKGAIEIGPRALGNRSILANPLCKGIKKRINSLKNRKFFRPISPMVSEDDYSNYFVETPPSPYMSFSPMIRSKFKNILSEIVHKDGSCRVQVVSHKENWKYNLLKEFQNLSGHPILANTSFNVQGFPLINDVEDAFQLLKSKKIDSLYINDIKYENIK